MNASNELERGRRFYAAAEWGAAHEALSTADASTPLAAEDLELLATSAYMLGGQDEYFSLLERAHRAYLDKGEALRAADCALWQGMTLASVGEMGRAGGWLARAQRLVEREGRDCVEQGYLLLPLMFQQEASGDLPAAIATAAASAEVAERFDDRDLFALAVHSQGDLMIRIGQRNDGLALLDEAMVAVTTEELSPIVSGIVYCGVILGCQAAFELSRAREWTRALSEWCDSQPEMVAFTGRCLVHRAEVLQLQGTWGEAFEEAERAGRRALDGNNQMAAGEAVYLQGELKRLRGDFGSAEDAYLEANRRGREPQPGLALLRLAKGDGEAAAAAIRRALAEGPGLPRQANLLAAGVEIAVAVNDLEMARDACGELERIALTYAGGVLDPLAASARGRIELADDAFEAALVSLRRAWRTWQEYRAPYEAARARVLIARACRALGDVEASAMEFAAARDAFVRLGAGPDVAAVDALSGATLPDALGLTPRELEVLRLVAGGGTNKAIAAELVLSERTVDRHLSNIYAKLGVASRAAATAFAYEHELL